MQRKNVIIFLVAGGLLVWFFWGMPLNELRGLILGVNLGWLILGVLIQIFSFYVRALRWHYLLRPVKRVSTGPLLSATFIGFAFNNLLPRAGELVRPYIIARRQDLSFSSTFATIVAERLVDFVAVFGICGFMALFLPLDLTDQAQGYFRLAMLLLGLISVGMAVFLLALRLSAERGLRFSGKILDLFGSIVLRPASGPLGRFIGEERARALPERLRETGMSLLRTFIDGLAVLESWGQMVVIMVLSFVMWLVITGGFFAVIQSVGGPMAELPFRAALFCMVISVLVMILPLPGGIGSMHKSLEWCFIALSIPRITAKGAALLIHSVNYIPIVLIGFGCLWWEGLSFWELRASAASVPGNGDETPIEGTDAADGPAEPGVEGSAAATGSGPA